MSVYTPGGTLSAQAGYCYCSASCSERARTGVGP
jgi:hypothetical protein